MKNTTWTKVQPGQIVSFIYKSKGETRGIKRTVMCLSPRYPYRKKNGRLTYFFVGLQLDTAVTRPITASRFQALIEQFGGLSKDKGTTEIGNFEDNISQSDVKILYKTLVDFIEKYKIFRTYNLRECRKRRVYLEDDYRFLPKESIDDLLLEQQINEFDFEL
tara:strand:+ start:2003 stop:2488 length:486 start_codon:yes stop_codon:yes gene_type:complete